MVSQKNLRAPWVAALWLLAAAAGSALELTSPQWGYSLDLPEGYSLAEKRGTDRYHFTHDLYPVDLQIALYPPDQFDSAEKALSWVTDQLSPQAPRVLFEWRRREAAIGRIETDALGGWALAVSLAEGKGYLALVAYGPEERAVELEPLMISSLDGIFTDEGSYFENGPMSAFAWPPEDPVTVAYQNGSNVLDLPFNKADSDAAQALVDREFSLLTAFLDTPYVIPAWKRYYRMIWRDSWARFSKASFMLGTVLPPEPEKILQELLSWTQGFTYERNFAGSDFTNLPKAFATESGDCDSRALLLVIMLNQLGVDAVLLVSPEYSHAVAAVDCPGQGARYELGGKSYLIADTTAKVGPGLIAQDMADSSKYFAVSFYAFPQKRD